MVYKVLVKLIYNFRIILSKIIVLVFVDYLYVSEYDSII